jgi:transposase-like protein
MLRQKRVRKQYSPEFKKEALLRAERDGATAAAKDLGLNVSQLYSWRAKERASDQVSEELRRATRGEWGTARTRSSQSTRYRSRLAMRRFLRASSSE